MQWLRSQSPWFVAAFMAAFGAVEMWQRHTGSVIICFVGAAFIAGLIVGNHLAQPAISEISAMAKNLAKENAILRDRMHLS